MSANSVTPGFPAQTGLCPSKRFWMHLSCGHLTSIICIALLHRNDAGLAAAEVALAVEAAVLDTNAIDAVCPEP